MAGENEEVMDDGMEVEDDGYGVPIDPGVPEPEPVVEPEADDDVDEDALKLMAGEPEKEEEKPAEPSYKDDPEYKAFLEFKAAQGAAKDAPPAEKEPTVPVSVTPEQFDSIFDADKGVEALNEVLASTAAAAKREAVAEARAEFEKDLKRAREEVYTQSIMLMERMLGAYAVFKENGDILAGKESVYGMIYEKELGKGQAPEEAAQKAMQIFKATARKAEAINKTAGRSVDLRGGVAAPKTKAGGARTVAAGAPSEAQSELARMNEIADAFRRGSR